MATLTGNIIANVIGSVWVGALTIAITPLQIRLLGIEAYGLIGFITVLQIALGALDLGLSATTTQIVAANRDKGLSAVREVIASVITVYWVVAMFIAVLLYLGASWISEYWFKPVALDKQAVTSGIRLIAVYVALRWPVAIYAGVLSGIERLDILNIIKSAAVSARLVGGVLILLVSPRLELFLAWFAFTACLELAGCMVACHLLIPHFPYKPRFSPDAIRRIWRFSIAMNGIALTSIALTQLDRVLMSKMLSLEALGYYALAYNTAHGFSLLQNAINAASFPAFTRSRSGTNGDELLVRFLKTSQLMSYCYALPCFALMFFGHDVLGLWIDDRAADGAYLSLALLELGFYCNAMVSGSYVLAIAFGQPHIPLKLNVWGMLFYIPLLYGLLTALGLVGAAIAWIVLNAYYMVTLVPAVQKQLLGQPMWLWLRQCVLPFFFLGLLTFAGSKALSLWLTTHSAVWVALAAAVSVYAYVGFRMMSTHLRSSFQIVLRTFGSHIWGSRA